MYEDVIEYLKGASFVMPEPLFWIRGDAGENWCFTCGKAEAKRRRRQAAREDKEAYVLAGGSYDQEEDSPARCSGCGKMLCYLLTQTGFDEESAHFLEHEWSMPFDTEIAYELLILFESGKCYFGTESALDQLAAKARRVIGLPALEAVA